MPAVDDLETLAALPLFRGLDEASLRELNARLHRRRVPASTVMISAQQPGEAVYILLDGSVKIQLDKEDGTQTTLAFLGPGDTVGEMSLVESMERSANVITLEDSTFLWLDRASFLGYLDSIPQLNRNLVSQLSARLRLANEKIQALATLDVAGRVARQILHFAALYGNTTDDGSVRIPLPLTQTDIAEMVAATRERVNRVIVDFKQVGAISVDSQHRIIIHRRELLERRCR